MGLLMSKFFFSASSDAADEFENLFNFVWPTAAALWNLRWQVKGFLGEASAPSSDHLSQRFVSGSGIQGVDLRKACIDQTWAEQQERLAGIILMNAFAIYEHWAEQIMAACGKRPGTGSQLQGNPTATRPGIRGVLTDFSASPSSAMSAAYYPVMVADKKFALSIIDNLSNCYWYFKEMRNCLAHRGGIASSVAEDAYQAFSQASSQADLGMRGALKHHAVQAGHPVRLDLRGVVGFSEVLLKIIKTVDAELSRSTQGEMYFISRMRTPATPQPSTLSSRDKRRAEQVGKRCLVCGFPRPKDPAEIYRLLRHHNIVSA
jgi:hypothetical protein